MEKNTSKVSRLLSIVNMVPLSNGEKTMLATAILESCDPTPESSLGKLFDTCLYGLQYITSVCESAYKTASFRVAKPQPENYLILQALSQTEVIYCNP